MGELISCILMGTFIILTIGFLRSLAKRKNMSQKGPVMNDSHYVHKLARLAKMSEYEVFKKTAENWQVTQAMIDQDFSKYLDSETAPYYVSHFIRENKKHLDELKMPHYLL